MNVSMKYPEMNMYDSMYKNCVMQLGGAHFVK